MELTGRHSGSQPGQEGTGTDTPQSPSKLPFTFAQLESDDVRLMGRKQEIIALRESLLEVLRNNETLSIKRNELRKSNAVLQKKLGDEMAENAKLQAVVRKLREDLTSTGLLDPMAEIQRLKAESKQLEISMSARKGKALEDHRRMMDQLEADYAARRADLEEELRQLELLIDSERDKLDGLRKRTGSQSQDRRGVDVDRTSGVGSAPAGLVVDRSGVTADEDVEVGGSVDDPSVYGVRDVDGVVPGDVVSIGHDDAPDRVTTAMDAHDADLSVVPADPGPARGADGDAPVVRRAPRRRF